MSWVLPFLIALQFLTIVPIRLPRIPSARENALSMLFYPIVGLLIGAVLWLVAMYLTLPVMLLSCVITALWVWLTGGLHLDGLADTADGWVGGYGDKQRTLEIMKDPNTGAMGVMAIVLCIAIKWAAIYSLLEFGFAVGLLVLPLFGRLVALFLFVSTPYVRKRGLGTAFEQMHKPLTVLVGVLSFAWLLVLPMQMALVLMVAFALLLVGLRYLFVKRLGGITGDTTGASIELIEALLSVVMVAMLTAESIGK